MPEDLFCERWFMSTKASTPQLASLDLRSQMEWPLTLQLLIVKMIGRGFGLLGRQCWEPIDGRWWIQTSIIWLVRLALSIVKALLFTTGLWMELARSCSETWRWFHPICDRARHNIYYGSYVKGVCSFCVEMCRGGAENWWSTKIIYYINSHI